MGVAEMKYEARLADLEVAIRHLQDAGMRLIIAGEHNAALAVTKLIKRVQEARDED